MTEKKIIKLAIIDDEQDILDMIEKYLRRSGDFLIVSFSSPTLALEQIDATYDVALIDIMMPTLNGIDLLKELRTRVPSLKIIMMTAYSTLDKILQSHHGGAQDYIMKPFSSMKNLEEKIRSVLL